MLFVAYSGNCSPKKRVRCVFSYNYCKLRLIVCEQYFAYNGLMNKTRVLDRFIGYVDECKNTI